MTTPTDIAVARFQEGYACSQSVLSAYAPLFDLDPELALRIAAPFGGGMGCMGEVCGAVTGAFMVLGLKVGNTLAQDKASKEASYDLARELIATAGKLDEGIAREPLAYVFLQSRDRHGAIPQYEDFLRYGEVLGAHYQEYWILAHYELGKLYESEGDPRKAMTYYERFLSIWRDGDEDLLPLKDARWRIDRLKHATAGD